MKTLVKARHYVPDTVASDYVNTGSNPWIEVSVLGTPSPLAQAGNSAAISHKAENGTGRFKEAGMIGYPGGVTFNRFASTFGCICFGAVFPLVPYFLSTLNAIGWWCGIPEQVHPEALVPGLYGVGRIFSGDMWGNLYPRSGFLYQIDDYKTAAVTARRAGDITTRISQFHVYLPMRATLEDGYWPTSELKKGDASTGKWQELALFPSLNYAVSPNSRPKTQAVDGDYTWALWRPYPCCQRKGQIFLGSIDL